MSDYITIRIRRDRFEQLFGWLTCAMRCMVDQQQASPLFHDRHEIAEARRGLCGVYWELTHQRGWVDEQELTFWQRLFVLIGRLGQRATPEERLGTEWAARELAKKIKASGMGYEDFWDSNSE